MKQQLKIEFERKTHILKEININISLDSDVRFLFLCTIETHNPAIPCSNEAHKKKKKKLSKTSGIFLAQ